jgi:hypothetical protein
MVNNQLEGTGRGLIERYVTSHLLPDVADDAMINLVGKTVFQPRLDLSSLVYKHTALLLHHCARYTKVMNTILPQPALCFRMLLSSSEYLHSCTSVIYRPTLLSGECSISCTCHKLCCVKCLTLNLILPCII